MIEDDRSIEDCIVDLEIVLSKYEELAKKLNNDSMDIIILHTKKIMAQYRETNVINLRDFKND